MAALRLPWRRGGGLGGVPGQDDRRLGVGAVDGDPAGTSGGSRRARRGPPRPCPVPGSPSTTVLRADGRRRPQRPRRGPPRPGVAGEPGERAVEAAVRGRASVLLRAGAGGGRQHPVQGVLAAGEAQVAAAGHHLDDHADGTPGGHRRDQQAGGPVGEQHPFLPRPGAVCRRRPPASSPGPGRPPESARAARLAMTMSSVTASTGPRVRAHVARNAAMTPAHPGAAALAQDVLDVGGRLLGEEAHEVVGLRAQARDVEDPGERAVGAAHRRAGAGEGLQPLAEVLRADDEGRASRPPATCRPRWCRRTPRRS